MTPDTPALQVARLAADEQTARRIADLLFESLDADGIAVAVAEQAHGDWIVEVHFQSPPDADKVRAVVALAAGDAPAQALTFETIAPRDWIKASLEGLRPVRAGRFVVHGRHDRVAIHAGAIGIEIEAALAFGTGHHGTTRGCLVALDRIATLAGKQKRAAHRARRSNPQPKILDLGTGSGVLAIAAAKALRARVMAGDIDRVATRAAVANARLNGVGPLIVTATGAGLHAPAIRGFPRYDLVFANILLGPLKALAVPIRHILAPNGCVVLSGLLAAQARSALAIYRAQGLVLERSILLDGWATLVLRRRVAVQKQTPQAAAQGV